MSTEPGARRVLVVGELNVDLVMGGLPSLPVLGQELLGTNFRMTLGSSSAITAARLAALGASVDFVGWVGDDTIGRFTLEQLTHYGVGVAGVQTVSDGATGVTIALTYAHDRALLTYPGVMVDFDGSTVTAELLAGYAHVHVGSFALQERLRPALPRIFRQAHARGLTTSLDIGWDPSGRWAALPYLRETLAECDYFFPNEDEVQALLGGAEDVRALASWVRGTLVVKRGRKGALAVPPQPERAFVEVPSWAVSVVDTTGAGDAFNAGFLYAKVLEGAALEEALRFAVACGAQAVTQLGGATGAPSADAIRRWIAEQVRGSDHVGDPQ